ncbi:unnamed protein product [Oncorhynchus mykiss]|uniref:MSP domain-containing protein n=1 Tax=Oncorhynchus mykiss TaxID=8022 RepID=A0A060Z0F8_ONCMY|nr:unnamed protein product [Oncorhynchus mykiss]
MQQQPMKGQESGSRGGAEVGVVKRKAERDDPAFPSPPPSPPSPLPIFLFPSELVFYSDQRSSHRRVLTLYNPYTFTIRFKMLCTAPSLYSVAEAEGSVRAKSCVDLVVRHQDVSPRHWGRRDRFRLEVSGGGRGRIGRCGLSSGEERPLPRINPLAPRDSSLPLSPLYLTSHCPRKVSHLVSPPYRGREDTPQHRPTDSPLPPSLPPPVSQPLPTYSSVRSTGTLTRFLLPGEMVTSQSTCIISLPERNSHNSVNMYHLSPLKETVTSQSTCINSLPLKKQLHLSQHVSSLSLKETVTSQSTCINSLPLKTVTSQSTSYHLSPYRNSYISVNMYQLSPL